MKSVLEYLNDVACRLPDKIAISMKEERYTFSELVNRARCLAAQIPDSFQDEPILVLAERKANVAIMFLAAIYSGNFYVPVDPNMPYEKLQAIVDDANPKVILGDDETKKMIENITYEGIFISVDHIKDVQRELPEFDSNKPLYMVYTSGSTGKPKGVLKSHGAIISYIETFSEAFDFSDDDIIGNQTPFYFDAAAKDFYLMLKKGISIEIIPTELFMMPPNVIEFLNEKKITVISWVPSALSIIAKMKTFTYIMPTTLRKVFFVGEVMPTKYLNVWREALPELLYVNLYGSSEIAGVCCYYEVKDEFEDSEALPMGVPFKNCKIYLVDNDIIVQEPEQTGEIYLVSDALAMGYFNDDVKTKNSFMYKDFGEGAVRCFKTGDLAQYDEHKNLIFKSRSDYQIKHMGHRIELGEIETVANSLDEVGKSCCLYDKEKSKIILFCELKNDFLTITGKEIQSLLRKKLSSYMLPSQVIVMDKLPLNANGKINRVLLTDKIQKGK